MSELSDKKTNAPKPGPPPEKTGYVRLWIFVALALLLIVPAVWDSDFSGKEITWQQFENDIISRKAVEKIVVVNKETAEIFIKKEFANDPYFKDEMRRTIGPQFFFTIGSLESLERKLDAAQKDFSAGDKIIVSYTKKATWFWSIVSWVIPLVLLFFSWSILLPRAETISAGSEGYSIFNIGRSTPVLVKKGKVL